MLIVNPVDSALSWYRPGGDRQGVIGSPMGEPVKVLLSDSHSGMRPDGCAPSESGLRHLGGSFLIFRGQSSPTRRPGGEARARRTASACRRARGVPGGRSVRIKLVISPGRSDGPLSAARIGPLGSSLGDCPAAPASGSLAPGACASASQPARPGDPPPDEHHVGPIGGPDVPARHLAQGPRTTASAPPRPTADRGWTGHRRPQP